MAKPLVAVVGRPNVGKSTFFNKIAGRRISIVEDTPGVTRDRIYADCEWLNYKFTLIDTGGIEPKTDDILLKQMRRQAEIAIDTCDVILFFTDGRTGMTADDEDVATMLRKSRKPVILVVNKVDHQGMNDNIYDFYTLGLGDPFPISATNMLGLGDLLDEMVKHFPKDEQVEDEEEHTIQIAVVGRPNVGKSSLVNRILGQERSMVSGIAGTTRDAIDTAFARDGQRYNIIDTAGIRRKRAIEEESIERYSIVRALAAVRRCDVALIVINAEDGVTEQDTKVAGYVHDEGKAAIIVVNKWDALEKDTNTMEAFRKKVIEDLKFMDYAPVLFISALTGQRVPKVLGKRSRGLWSDLPPHHNRSAQRHSGRRNHRAPAAVYQRPSTQDLLRNAAERLPADIRAVCQRRKADALRLSALFGKPVPANPSVLRARRSVSSSAIKIKREMT